MLYKNYKSGIKILSCGIIISSFIRIPYTKDRRYFIINDDNKFIEKEGIFFCKPWTEAISVPKSMMDGTANIYGSNIHERFNIPIQLDTTYKITNPTIYYRKYRDLIGFTNVIEKNSFLSELFSKKYREKIILNDKVYILILAFNIEYGIKQRRDRTIALLEYHQVESLSKKEFKNKVEKLIDDERKILNGKLSSKGLIFEPKRENIVSWLKPQLKFIGIRITD